jgi:palmitoyl-protein thioesterase
MMITGNDPFHHSEFMSGSMFLPKYTFIASDYYKANFLRLKKAIFLGSRDDEVIEPYQSALFSFWNFTSTQDDFKLVEMKDQRMFTMDYFGLKTMHDSGRLNVKEHPGVGHVDWLSREDLFLTYMQEYLY